MKKLYVGNLPFSITPNGLKEMFAVFGDISEETVVMDRQTGKSKGFGFVTISDDAAAEAAIAQMNGKELEGRAIKVSEAKPMVPR
jgi:cold-inducible RNA-binding protein